MGSPVSRWVQGELTLTNGATESCGLRTCLRTCFHPEGADVMWGCAYRVTRLWGCFGGLSGMLITGWVGADSLIKLSFSCLPWWGFPGCQKILFLIISPTPDRWLASSRSWGHAIWLNSTSHWWTPSLCQTLPGQEQKCSSVLTARKSTVELSRCGWQPGGKEHWAWRPWLANRFCQSWAHGFSVPHLENAMAIIIIIVAWQIAILSFFFSFNPPRALVCGRAYVKIQT